MRKSMQFPLSKILSATLCALVIVCIFSSLSFISNNYSTTIEIIRDDTTTTKMTNNKNASALSLDNLQAASTVMHNTVNFDNITQNFLNFGNTMHSNLNNDTIMHNTPKTTENGEIYYRIIGENTILYRTPLESNESSNVYFRLPTTYFVKFNSAYDELFLNVTYRDFTGYVLADNVERVYSTPVTPYAVGQTFSVQGIANLVLRSEPTTQSEYIGTIPFNATDIEFFGAIEGEQANPELSNIWYYCRYTSFEQGILTGYVYAPLTQNLVEIPENTEVVDMEPNTEVNGDGVIAPELQNSTSIWLIIGLTIPALILLLLVLKPSKRRHQRAAKRQIANLNKLSIPEKTDKDEFDF